VWTFLTSRERTNVPLRGSAGRLMSLSKALPGHELLPPRERMVLAGIVRGASNEAILVTTATSQRQVGNP
jgi:hypothetical protein